MRLASNITFLLFAKFLASAFMPEIDAPKAFAPDIRASFIGFFAFPRSQWAALWLWTGLGCTLFAVCWGYLSWRDYFRRDPTRATEQARQSYNQAEEIESEYRDRSFLLDAAIVYFVGAVIFAGTFLGMFFFYPVAAFSTRFTTAFRTLVTGVLSLYVAVPCVIAFTVIFAAVLRSATWSGHSAFNLIVNIVELLALVIITILLLWLMARTFRAFSCLGGALAARSISFAARSGSFENTLRSRPTPLTLSYSDITPRELIEDRTPTGHDRSPLRWISIIATLIGVGLCLRLYLGGEHASQKDMSNLAANEYNLGVSYYRGWGVVKDYGEAVKWYRKAAERNHALAQFYLGVCYYRGDGVAENHAQAVNWYRKAAEQNLALAQYYLGICYKNGQGVPRDYVEAYKWWWLAASQGNEAARRKMTELETEMTREQVTEGETLVRNFRNE